MRKSGFDTNEKTIHDSERELPKEMIMHVSPYEKWIVFCWFVTTVKTNIRRLQNLTYDLNDTYEMMIEFETLREIYKVIWTMTTHNCNKLEILFHSP